MSTQELGAPAYKKYDMEAWMPGNQFYGEVNRLYKKIIKLLSKYVGIPIIDIEYIALFRLSK